MQRGSIENELRNVQIPGGVFLIREDIARGASALTAHVFEGIDTQKKRDLRAVLAEAGAQNLRLSVHRPKALRSAGSLAALDRRFAGGPIVYDPTAMFRRTEAVVHCATMIREALGKKAGKIFIDTSRRTLYIVLDEKAFEGQGLPFRAQAAEAMAIAAKTVRTWKLEAPADFELAVRVGFEPPAGVRLVAVDDKSRAPSRFALSNISSRLRKAVGAVAVGAVAAGATTAAYAGDGDPNAAVATPNLTLIGQGTYDSGLFSHSDHEGGDGAIEGVLPLGHSFGVQAEGGVGSDSYYGGAGHLFWRDPSWGMLGGFVSDESLKGETMQRYGGEAELYLDQLTLSARGGDQSGDVQHGGFGRIDLGFYATPNFVLRGGFEGTPLINFGRAGVEFQPAAESWSGLSVYVDGEFGRGTAVIAGIKLHFGEQGESLIYRDRHEDPSLAIFNQFPLAAGHKSHYVAPPPT